MTDSTDMHTVATPQEDVAAAGESDAAELADELGQVGIQTVDDDKLSAPVEQIDRVDSTTVRLWYRFPTGELIPEEFEKPVLWDVTESKLARIIAYTSLTPETFSKLETSDDVEVILEETTVPKDEVDLDALAAAAPTPAGADTDTTPDDLYFKEEGAGAGKYTTWQATDPIDLVDDSRFTEDADEDTDDEPDSLLVESDADTDYLSSLAMIGFFVFTIAGVGYLIITGLFIDAMNATVITNPATWLVFAGMGLLAGYILDDH